MDFDYDKDAKRYWQAIRAFSRYFRNGTPVIERHMKVAYESLNKCAQNEKAMKLIHEAAQLLRKREMT